MWGEVVRRNSRLLVVVVSFGFIGAHVPVLVWVAAAILRVVYSPGLKLMLSHPATNMAETQTAPTAATILRIGYPRS